MHYKITMPLWRGIVITDTTDIQCVRPHNKYQIKQIQVRMKNSKTYTKPRNIHKSSLK